MPSEDSELDSELSTTRFQVIQALSAIEEELLDLRDRQAGLQAALRGLNVALGIEEERPKGADAVAIVAREAIAAGNDHDEDWAPTVAEIVESLGRRGWLPDSEKPEGAVRASIRRLRQQDPRWGLFKGRLYYHDRVVPSEDDAVGED